MVIAENSIIHGVNNNNSNQNKAQIKDILKKIKPFSNGIFGRLTTNKEKIKILIPIAGISILLMIYMITKTFVNVQELNNEGSQLNNISHFNTKILENNSHTSETMTDINTLNELISYEDDLKNEMTRYNKYLETLQSPYSNLMKHILLPQLNIRKDPFIGDIDISIIGQKYLEKNPYDDIKLIQQWSNFFKNVGNNNEFNQIEEITIGDLIEENDLFYIPITVKFIANSKRSFLLLVEKLSTTSNGSNIALINEFMYNLWKNIKEDKKDSIKILSSQYDTGFDEDKVIGYHVYQRIFQDKKNELITDKIINKTIKDTIVCGNESDAYCYYKFRDKYRSIPSLAYTIGLEDSKNKIQKFKKFLKNLPPVININKFTFDRNIKSGISNYEKTQYKGEIQMDIYGKGISNNDVKDIAVLLGDKCLGTELTPQAALNKIDKTLVNIGNITKGNTTNTSTLREIQKIIENVQTKYNGFSNYKKTIKLFEIYRMLQDGNLCNM